MKRKLSLLSMAVFLSFALACASLQSNTYKTLSISKTTYDTAMSTAADLYKQGKLTDSQKAQVIALGNTYKDAHNAVVSAFKKATSSGLLSDERDYLIKLSSASIILSDLLLFIQPFIQGR